MKQKDVAILVVVAVISAIASLALSNIVFSTPKARSQKVETIDVVSDSFTPPDNKYFNSQSIDPAQLVQLTSNDHQNPFSAPSH